MRRIIISNEITSPSGIKGTGLQLEVNGKVVKSTIALPETPLTFKTKIALARLAIKEIFQSDKKVKLAAQVSLLSWEWFKKYLENKQ